MPRPAPATNQRSPTPVSGSAGHRFRIRMALCGCTSCGIVHEAETELKVGHLTRHACPDCGAPMRVVNLSEAHRLTRERFLTDRWCEIAGPGREMQSLADGRTPARRHGQLDSDPRQLRETLGELDGLLDDCKGDLRRRVLLMVSGLVTSWHGRFSGEPISAVIEPLPDAARMSLRNSRRELTRDDWEELVTATVVDVVDAWGIDRRFIGSAWFEFRLDRSGT